MMPIVPLHHLVALKLTTDPGIDPSRYVRDQADLVALRDRGLVDAARVPQVLEDVSDGEARARLIDLVAAAKLPRPAKRSPSGGDDRKKRR